MLTPFIFVGCIAQVPVDSALLDSFGQMFKKFDVCYSSDEKAKIKETPLSIQETEIESKFISIYRSNEFKAIDGYVEKRFGLSESEREFYVFRLYRGHLLNKRFDLRSAMKKGIKYGFPPEPKQKVPLPKSIPVPE